MMAKYPERSRSPFFCPKHQAEQMLLITLAAPGSTRGAQGCSLLLGCGQLFQTGLGK